MYSVSLRGLFSGVVVYCCTVVGRTVAAVVFDRVSRFPVGRRGHRARHVNCKLPVEVCFFFTRAKGISIFDTVYYSEQFEKAG